MMKHLSFVLSTLSLLAAGCFGKDPNQNSQVAPGADGSSGGTVDASLPIVGTPLATFDTTLNGFVLNPYHELPTSGQVNLGDPNSGLATMASDPTVDSSVGSPTAGSVEIMAPFSGANQYVDFQNTTMFGTARPQNWMGGTLHVRVKVDGGSFVGIAQPYVDTGMGYVFGGQSTNYPKGNDWQEFTVNVNKPTNPTTPNAGYDPTQVIAFGIQISSGSAGGSQAPVTFHIDSFSIAGIAAPSTGTGGTAGANGSGGAGGNHDASAGN
jgi:hypothetical protein